MPLVPFAAFLVGSLLSLLLPTALLTALVVWYMRVVRRSPDSGDSNPSDAAGGSGAGVSGASGDARPPHAHTNPPETESPTPGG